MVFAYIACFATAIFYAFSAVLEDRAAKSTPLTGTSGKRAAVQATLRPLYVAGMALSVVAWSLSLYALQSLPLFAVQAIAASSIGVVALIVWINTGHRPPRREAWLLIALGVGLVGLAVSAAPTEPERVHWAFKLVMWIGVVVVAFAAIRATHVHGARGSALLGVVSGLADGGMALCARSIHGSSFVSVITDPVAIALVPFTIMGVVTFAGALQRGSASVALACQQAVATVVPSAIGLVVLGDRARHGFAPVTVIGFIVTVGSVIGITLDSAAHPSEAALASTV